jgi:membrane dipeptidase
MRPIMVDAHQDLAYNMLEFGRDYTRPALETRQCETGTETTSRNGDSLLGWPDYQQGRVGVIFSTLFAPPRHRASEWEKQVFNNPDQAHRVYRVQLEAYQRLADRHPDKFRYIQTISDLESVLQHWDDPAHRTHPVGLVPLMECAEAVRTPQELEEWWAMGLRLIGPAWAGTRFCGGTGEPGPLTAEGEALLEGMADLGFLLDLSHMDPQAALQALDRYPGQIIASHSNAASLLKGYAGNRLLPDEVIHGLLEREGVIGVVPLNSFLLAGWKRSDGRHHLTLGHLVAQIDYICQMAGNALHVGIGTDFDGGFGVQSVPPEIDTIADLHKLVPLLSEKGYSEEDVAAIFGQNWLRKLRSVLAEA